MTTSIRLPQRQVHLDFHTSPYITDVAVEFNATEFADTLKRAHVNSVTIFAKCHHGYTYFPSKACPQHPALRGRDLLGEQIEALHRVGIRCPIYITVGWEARAAQEKPEWRAMYKNGLFGDWPTEKPGQWKFLNWLHPEYQDHIAAVTQEVLDRYGRDVDGFFYDIVFFPKGACWSPESIKFREKHNLWDDSLAGFEHFLAKAQASFSERFYKQILSARPEATVFINAGSDSFLKRGLGGRARYPFMTHMEIESLPSGFWGYYHFPRLARSTGHWGKPWLGMTGRFQTLWGDFGGLKPQPALEYECFRSQAMGGANSIGDQLPPRGRLDAGAYDLIGAVYKQCEAAEPFYEGSTALPQIGIYTSGTPGVDGDFTNTIDEGAIQMCDESHYDSFLLDAEDELTGLDLVILGDACRLTPEVIEKLRAYYQSGGRLLISHKGGFGENGQWALDFLPVRVEKEMPYAPSYWRATENFWPEFRRSDRVVYERGLLVQAPGTEMLVERVFPYFQRDDVRYCSHLQTPPRAEASGYPAVLAGERFVYFADPIFFEYRTHGNIAVRDVWKRCVERLIGAPLAGAGLPSTVFVVPRRRGSDLIVTLLHYIPVRKALKIDMIEERSSFAGEILRIRGARSARIFQGPELKSIGPGEFELPPAKGRLLIEVPGYFG